MHGEQVLSTSRCRLPFIGGRYQRHLVASGAGSPTINHVDSSREGPGLQTRRWREVDSNRWSHLRWSQLRRRRSSEYLISPPRAAHRPSCDIVSVIDHGEKIAEGPPDEIREDHRVIEAYSGKEMKDAEVRAFLKA